MDLAHRRIYNKYEAEQLLACWETSFYLKSRLSSISLFRFMIFLHEVSAGSLIMN
jgi:hypothetical protein